MDSGQLQRIQTISDLMRRSQAAASENLESANGVAISLLHDAIEHALYFVLLDTNHAAKAREEFKELLGEVAKIYLSKTGEALPFLRRLQVLNSLRIAFKHHGTRPSKNTTQEALAYGGEFLRALFDSLYSFEIDSFRLIETLRIVEVRDLLLVAESLADAGETDEAMTKLALANYRVNEAISAIFSPPDAPMRLSSPFGEDRDFRRELVEYIGRGDKHTLVTAVLIASGQDVAGFTSARMLLPVVYAFIGGSFGFDKITPHPYTADDVRFCLDQMSRVAIWLEERFPFLDFRDGRWTTGTVSPWSPKEPFAVNKVSGEGSTEGKE
jgi:hypothetical protein